MPEQDSFGKVCAVVVTYNIGEACLKHFETLKNQADRIFVVDNGSDAATINVLQKIRKDNKDKAEIIFNGENLGVGRAQNIGIEKAVEEGYDWVLLLDHDSFLKEDMISVMKGVYSSLSRDERERTAVLAPNIFDTGVNLSSKYTRRRLKYFFSREACHKGKHIDVLTVIASGSLIKTAVLKRLGLMREDFFIDYIDTEFSLRVISHGLKIIVVCDAVLYHTLGSRRLYKVFNINMKPTFHPPMRRFYIYRNRMRLLRAYIFREPSYAFLDIVLMLYDIFNIAFFENDKLDKFKMILKGALSGIRK